MDKELLFLSLLLAAAAANRHDVYEGFSVHGVVIKDSGDAAVVMAAEERLQADVWQEAGGRGVAYVMLPPDSAGAFLDTLDDHGIEHYLHIEDVVELLEEEDKRLSQWNMNRRGRMATYETYPRYAEVDDYLEEVAARYPDLVTLVTAGLSYEGRPVKYLKISSSGFTDSSKPVYVMEAALHAREWVTVPAALYCVHRLLVDLRDADRDLLQDVDWLIFPLVNPDGYEYSHTTERLWRKTRSVLTGVNTTCLGVDANRNFDVFFNTLGVSSNPCSLTYPGTSAFSEPETALVRDVLAEHLNRTQIFMDIHSHGNWILFGYGDSSLTPNAPQLHAVGAAMGAAIDAHKLPQAPFYRVGNSAQLLYPTSGSAQDYAQFIGVPFSYTLELPGLGYFFEVPPQYIDQINEETWQGIAVTARLARTYYRARTQN